MLKNRLILVIGVLSLLLVAMAVSFSLSDTPSSADYTDRWEAMGEYYANQAAEKLGDSNACSNMTQENIFAEIPNNLDSGTRSYVAWAQAVEAEPYVVDSATQSYIARAKAIEAERDAIDSATRSYIAWGKAVEAQRLVC